MEFASGNYGLMQSALDYQRDVTPPVVNTVMDGVSDKKYEVRFTSNEASSIYYTLDGSTPTTASTEWKPNRARALPLPLLIAPGTTLKWIAHDFKGNLSAVQSRAFGFTEVPGNVGGNVPATLSLTLSAPAVLGPFVPGVAREYSATSEANVISSAGDAALTVSGLGPMTNGAFSLASPPQLSLSKSAWTAPVSNDKVTITYKQAIGSNEPLRTGTYSKSVTFTLSTTTP